MLKVLNRANIYVVSPEFYWLSTDATVFTIDVPLVQFLGKTSYVIVISMFIQHLSALLLVKVCTSC